MMVCQTSSQLVNDGYVSPENFKNQSLGRRVGSVKCLLQCRGPLMGQLKSGETVTLDSGAVVSNVF